jgi:hypothetical protein
VPLDSGPSRFGDLYAAESSGPGREDSGRVSHADGATPVHADGGNAPPDKVVGYVLLEQVTRFDMMKRTTAGGRSPTAALANGTCCGGTDA